ncbi:DUF4238 domain-containing protein [Chitinophaga ginsengisoli]|uniref:Uncharacterized protein DUF4238 n=1 Tax=Chitinophaga ginsengisoli TaxID=363837 RepID=A0A2P8GE68_9BACT|nr:DUF4238 domain-containing protein [Chitinophaga ginsengisoli]PSL32277.1 uncharacterized protein DUF4238 [Chitinophaga ginsengisoli]
MSVPVRQHYIPKSYLRHFAINPKDNQLRSMIWHGWIGEYGPRTEKTSINSDKFKIEHFYTVPSNEEDPYIIERTFSAELEPRYSQIIKEVQEEGNLSLECRGNIMLWLFFSKYRNLRFRNHMEDLVKWYSHTVHAMQYGKDAAEAERMKFEIEAKYIAKQIQVEHFANEKLLEEFDRKLGSKEWRIWKSRKGNEFITTDDPGFSINMEPDDLQNLNGLFAGNAAASNFFPLTPKYCVEIVPFRAGTPVSINLRNQVIPFAIASNTFIDFINGCSIRTRNKYIIGSSKEKIQNLLQS